jgi:hypothetical protein
LILRNPREDLRVPDAAADLYLVGLGIGSFERRTVEVDEILRGCSTILHLTAFDAELRSIYGADVVSLIDLYESSDNPHEVYSRMSDLIFEYATNNLFLGPIAYLTYGHPLFLVDASWDLMAKGKIAGLRVKPIAATSYVDQLLCDLAKRFDRGLQQYEAELFVSHRVALDDRFPLLLAQVGDFGSETLRPEGHLYERLTKLMTHLHDTYPSDRICHLIMSSWRSDIAPEVHTASIGKLETLLSSVHVGCSLYVEGIYD